LLTAYATRDIYAMAAEHAPVALHGHPADAVLSADLTRVLRSLGPLALISALLRYTIALRRPPYFFFRSLLERSPSPDPEPLPDWLLVRAHRVDIDPSAPFAVSALQSPGWSSYFEWAHPLQTRAALEVSYPWSDVRVIEETLATEAIPWLADKMVLRKLLRGRISEKVRTRRKTYLTGDPWTASIDGRDLTITAASRYVDPTRFLYRVQQEGRLSDMTLRAIALDYWIRRLSENTRQLQSGATPALD
jgi:hypothetical protein